MMEPVIKINKSGVNMNSSAIKELLNNNCTMPNIKRVIYNLKTKEVVRDENGNKVRDTNGNLMFQDLKNPVLATVVEFIDNTKVTVTNSENDAIQLVDQYLDSEGNVIQDPSKAVKTVKTASEFSKEVGLLYAIFKRYCGTVDHKGTVVGDGAGRILREIVSDAYDTSLEEPKNTLKKAASKAKHESRQQQAQENKQQAQENKKTGNPSLAQTVKDLSEVVKSLLQEIIVKKLA